MSEEKERTLQPPVIGSAEAAVLGLVNLMAYALELRENQLAYWLDCYYQLRRQYETEIAPEPDPTILRKSDLEPVLRQMWEDTLKTTSKKEAAKRLAERQAAKEQAPKIIQEGTGAASPAAAAAAFKREVLARLEAARAAGLSIGAIVKASGDLLTENQLLTILEGGRVPVGTYRDLDAVLGTIASNS